MYNLNDEISGATLRTPDGIIIARVDSIDTIIPQEREYFDITTLDSEEVQLEALGYRDPELLRLLGSHDIPIADMYEQDTQHIDYDWTDELCGYYRMLHYYSLEVEDDMGCTILSIPAIVTKADADAITMRIIGAIEIQMTEDIPEITWNKKFWRYLRCLRWRLRELWKGLTHDRFGNG